MSYMSFSDTEHFSNNQILSEIRRRRAHGHAYTSLSHVPPPAQHQARPKLRLARAILVLIPAVFFFLCALAVCLAFHAITGCPSTSVCAMLADTRLSSSGINEGAKILHTLGLKLPGLLKTLGTAAIQLPGLLQRSHVNMVSRLTGLINNARSLSGTPACPSADCVRIAARSVEMLKNFKKTSEVIFVTMGVVSILMTAHYVNKYFTLLLRGIVDSISTTFSGKWEPGARPPPSPLHRHPMPQLPSPVSGRPRVRLGRLAEEASVLLEVFSRAIADGSVEAGAEDDQKTMIVKTLKNVLEIKKELHIVTPEMDEKPEDNVCIICYDNVADMVVLPCRHLAMCVTCCDGMRIMERGVSSYSNAKCPICRSIVTDRMKIFRS